MPKTGRCKTPGCGRPRKKRNTYCCRCATRRWAANQPASYTLNKLRSNAKRRGIPFSITLEEFKAFCASHPDYLTARGRNSRCLSIDRVKSWLGYSIDNIRLLTVAENSRRAAEDTNSKRWPATAPQIEPNPEDGDPF